MKTTKPTSYIIIDNEGSISPVRIKTDFEGLEIKLKELFEKEFEANGDNADAFNESIDVYELGPLLDIEVSKDFRVELREDTYIKSSADDDIIK